MQSFSMQGHKRVHHVNFLQPHQRGWKHFSLPEYSENSGKCISITLSTHAVMRPDCHIIFFHQGTCRHCDLTAARHHPSYYTDSGRKYNRALGRHLPEFSSKYFILQRQYKCQCDHIRGMCMINIGNAFFHFMVHQVARQLTGQSASVYQQLLQE